MALMDEIAQAKLEPGQGAIWPLGQAGFVMRAGGTDVKVAIDPYITDSVGRVNPDFARLVPPPLEPGELCVDVMLITHDHMDHLDPDTIKGYRYAEATTFVAPRLAVRKLVALGIPQGNVVRVDSGESACVRGVTIQGIFALGTSPDVPDTTGYAVRFANGRSLYHASDTAFCQLLLDSAPKDVDLLVVPINGKMGNLGVDQAAALTRKIRPPYAMPCHYDVMALNSENPEAFAWACKKASPATACVIPRLGEPFIWTGRGEVDGC